MQYFRAYTSPSYPVSNQIRKVHVAWFEEYNGLKIRSIAKEVLTLNICDSKDDSIILNKYEN